MATPLFRPSEHKGQVSFASRQNEFIADVILDADGELAFAVYRNGAVTTEKQVGELCPLALLKPYNATGLVRLCGEPIEYGTTLTLAQAIDSYIDAYFDCTAQQRKVALCYSMMTHLTEKCPAAAILRFVASYGNGKSRGSRTIGSVCYRPISVTGASSTASIFRILEIAGGTLLLDEADYDRTGVGQEISKILNQGYEKGNPVLRTIQRPDGEFVPKSFDVFGPKIVAGRRFFDDEAVESRSLLFRCQATTRTDIPKLWTPAMERRAAELRQQLLMFRLRHLDSFECLDFDIPGLDNRTNQIILPLASMARMIDAELGDRIYEPAIIDFARAQDSLRRDDRRCSLEGKLIAAYDQWKDSRPIVGDLRKAVIEMSEGDDPKMDKWLTTQEVGRILRETGFSTRHSNRGKRVYMDLSTLAGLKLKYGIGKEEEEGVR